MPAILRRKAMLTAAVPALHPTLWQAPDDLPARDLFNGGWGAGGDL